MIRDVINIETMIANYGEEATQALLFSFSCERDGTQKNPSSARMISGYNSQCYFLQAAGEDRHDPCAQGLSAGMMKTQSSYTGFDFDEVWYMDPHAPHNNYPQLRACLQDRITSVEIEKKPDLSINPKEPTVP